MAYARDFPKTHPAGNVYRILLGTEEGVGSEEEEWRSNWFSLA